jgi:chromate reductase
MKLNVVGICGSLRTESYNLKALRVAERIARDAGAEVVEIEQSMLNLPLYNQDVEDRGVPEVVTALRAQVEKADVIFVATPEYNASIPACLKNAIDWLSRQGNAFKGKTAVLFGASNGMNGTVRAQSHVREILQDVRLLMLPKPQVFIRNAGDAFNEDGSFKDQKTHDLLKDLVEQSLAMAAKLK